MLSSNHDIFSFKTTGAGFAEVRAAAKVSRDRGLISPVRTRSSRRGAKSVLFLAQLFRRLIYRQHSERFPRAPVRRTNGPPGFLREAENLRALPQNRFDQIVNNNRRRGGT
jgi:hypothetical protein